MSVCRKESLKEITSKRIASDFARHTDGQVPSANSSLYRPVTLASREGGKKLLLQLKGDPKVFSLYTTYREACSNSFSIVHKALKVKNPVQICKEWSAERKI